MAGIRPRLWYDPKTVKNEFTAIIQQAEGWYIAFSPEVPAANGQGRTRAEAIESLSAAIDLVLEDLREESLSQLSAGDQRDDRDASCNQDPDRTEPRIQFWWPTPRSAGLSWPAGQRCRPGQARSRRRR